jgi:hypothetical protein
MAMTESRHGDGGDRGPPRFVAATGTSRSTPGASHTTQARPTYCLLATPSSGSVSP